MKASRKDEKSGGETEMDFDQRRANRQTDEDRRMETDEETGLLSPADLAFTGW